MSNEKGAGMISDTEVETLIRVIRNGGTTGGQLAVEYLEIKEPKDAALLAIRIQEREPRFKKHLECFVTQHINW